MKSLRRIRRPLSAALLFMLLLSTSGFSLHAIYCLCKGELTYSLFASTDEVGLCNMDPGSERSCCSSGPVREKPVCSTDARASCCSSIAGDAHPCTTEEVIYTRLATVFLLQEANVTARDQSELSIPSPAFAILPAFRSVNVLPNADLNPWPRGPGILFPFRARHLIFSQFRC